jgi:thiamine biosynthesis protein ThiS
MRVRVNGVEQELESGVTVATLLERFQLRGDQVAVERNRELVPRARFAEAVLAEGDEVEIVTLVGGG